MAKEILSAQHARDEKEKLEKIISKLKLPLLISAVCSAVFYFVMYLTVNEILGTDFISQAIMIIGFAAVAGMLLTTIVAIIFGGKTIIKIIGSILFFGFIFIPIPIVNIFIGFVVLLYSFFAFFVAPWLILIIAIIKMKRDIKKYNEYLQYCPDDAEPVAEVNE